MEQYVDDTFAVVHKESISHTVFTSNSSHNSFQFTFKFEKKRTFLDVLLIQLEVTLDTMVINNNPAVANTSPGTLIHQHIVN